MDVTKALEAAAQAVWIADVDDCEGTARAAIVAFLEGVPDWDMEKTTAFKRIRGRGITATVSEKMANTPSRILAAIREAQS